VMHVDSGGDVWVAAQPRRSGENGTGADSAPIQAYLAFSKDRHIQWRLGIPIGRFDAIEDLRSSGLPSVSAPADKLLAAVLAADRGADVIVLTGLEGPGLDGLRGRVLDGMPRGWTVAKSGRAAWRSNLNVNEPE